MSKTLKQNLESDIDENTDLTESYMDKINKSFFTMLKNPTEKEIEKHRKIRDALIAAWLALFLKDFEDQLYNSAQKGIDEADKQLKAKKITQIKDKSITADTFENQVKSRLNSFKTDFAYVSDSIKANYERVVKEIKNNPLATTNKEQKLISTQTAESMGKIGCTYFYDRAGKKIDINNYTKVKTLWDSIQAMRLAFFVRAIQHGVDLAKIIHLNIHPHCPLCKPFEGKILSLTGKTKGYMSVWEAEQYGLFHPFCDHVPDDIELAPEDNGNEGKISLNEANRKRYAYNRKRAGFAEEIIQEQLSGQKAIEKLLNDKNGVINNAFSRKDIGDIDLIWGDENKGLKHIIERHQSQNINLDEFLPKLTDVIQNGELVRVNDKGRYEIFKDGIMAIIDPNNGNPFLLTAFKRRKA